MHFIPIYALLVALSTTAVLPSQKSWIVDAAKGAGYDFSDIQPAFNKAKPGDRILVRKGNYLAATTNKGVQLLGAPGVNIQFRFPATQTAALVIRGLPANQTFVMKGFTLTDASLGRTMMFLDGNQGRVHLESVDLSAFASRTNPLTAQFRRPALIVRNCKQVTIAGSTLGGRPGLSVEGSTMALSGCTMRGSDAGQFSEIIWQSRPGLWASKSQLTIARSSASGGAGKLTSNGVRPASPAAVLQNCRTILSGEAFEIWQAGKISKSEKGMNAIEAASGQLLLDPTLKLLPQGKSSAVSGSAVIYRTRIPSLKAAGAAPGGILRTDLYAQSGNLQLLLASSPGRIRTLPMGDLWLDLAHILYLDASVLDKTQHRLLAIPIPTDPRLRGTPIAIQSLGGSPNRWLLSNPTIVILY